MISFSFLLNSSRWNAEMFLLLLSGGFSTDVCSLPRFLKNFFFCLQTSGFAWIVFFFLHISWVFGLLLEFWWILLLFAVLDYHCYYYYHYYYYYYYYHYDHYYHSVRIKVWEPKHYKHTTILKSIWILLRSKGSPEKDRKGHKYLLLQVKLSRM